MASTTLKDLRTRTDAAWANLTRQLQGMEPHMERADAPGEWTTREVLSHLMFESGWQPADFLKTFAVKDLPVGEIEAGSNYMDAARRTMTLRQFVDALDGQRRSVFAYLESIPEADLEQRKARIPLFKTFMGTDEIPIAVYVGAMFDYHWNDHAGQLAKIRKTAGLPNAG
jgi:hypothetical protein